MKHCSKDDIIDFGVQFLKAKGVAGKSARIVTEIAVKTQAMGIHTHGLAVFPYFDRSIPNPLNPAAQPEVVKESAATAVVDGNFGFAQLALNELAGQYGIQPIAAY